MLIADVEGAFLRGDELHRKGGRVLIQLPPGGVEGVPDGCLIEAAKAAYGLADAPLAWYQSFTRSLESLGCRRSVFDQCVFYVYNTRAPHDLIGVIAVHVDDMIMGGNEEFNQRILIPLRQKYPFKHWHEGKGTFLGKELLQLENGDIQIQQREYALNVKGVEIAPARKKELDSPTTEGEKQQMRAVLGAINWLVSGSRPDLAAGCSLLQQRVTKSCVGDLVDMNRFVKLVHDNALLTIL